MKQIFITLLLAIGFSVCVQAQDVVIKNDKTEFKAKVLKVSDSEIEYKKWEMQDGPSYTINKRDVFMIIYKNGTRETFETTPVVTSSKATETAKVAEPVKTETKTVKTPEELSDYTFSIRDKSKPKGKDNFSDRILRFGVFPETIGDISPIPSLRLSTDVFFTKNIAGFVHVGGSYHKEEDNAYGMEISTTALTEVFGAGANYYFNELMQLDKNKYTVFGGAYVTMTMATVDVKVGNDSTYDSANDFGLSLRIGGDWRFSKLLGLNTEIHVPTKGDAAFLVGLTFFNTKGYKK